MNITVNQIITALLELKAKECHSVYFEYGNGLFRVRIFRGEACAENIIYEKTIEPVLEQTELEKLYRLTVSLMNYIVTAVSLCYRRDLVKGKRYGEWEKVKPVFEVGVNATQSMLCDGSGYYIDDPDNEVQYFVDMKMKSEF